MKQSRCGPELGAESYLFLKLLEMCILLCGGWPAESVYMMFKGIGRASQTCQSQGGTVLEFGKACWSQNWEQ